MTTTSDRVEAGVRSLERRLTLTAVAVVAIVLAVTGVILVLQHQSRLMSGVDDALRLRASDVITRLDSGDDAPFSVGNVEDEAVQIVGLDGSVRGSSANLAVESPIAPAPDGDESVRTVDQLPIEDDRFRILSRRASLEGQPVIVHVAENVDDVFDSTRLLATSLLVAFPLVLAVLGWFTWWLVRRTLRPVGDAAVRQGEFVGNASHELRGPLARVRARVEVELARAGDGDFRAAAGDVVKETIAMERLVDDLLHLARSDAAGEIERAPVDLDDLVMEEAAALRARSDLTVDVSRVSGASINGHRPGLVRLVRNLVDNAGHHARTTVNLELGERDDNIRLVVDDDGPGIEPDHRSGVFERFARLDDARSGDSGTGLGLAIVKAVVEAHGGTISIDTADLGGARFTVTLPGS